MTKQLTKEQLAVLVQYERLFHQAVDACYCSYPGQEALDKMLAIWNELTGEDRKLRAGCSTCIFHLVKDLGVLYFAQKPAVAAPSYPAGPVTHPKPKTPATAKKGTNKKK